MPAASTRWRLCYAPGMRTSEPVRPVALVGLSGAGKTAVGPVLAARLGGGVADLDARIAGRAGLAIPELFARDGEAAFRRLECAELERAINEGVAVIACGGGIVDTPEARVLLRERCRAIWLEVDPLEAASRVAAEPGQRPLLAAPSPAERLGELLARRAPHYAAVAFARVATGGRSAAEVAEQVARALEMVPRSGTSA